MSRTTNDPDEARSDSDSVNSAPADSGLESKTVQYRPLRVWPAVVLLIGMAATRFLPDLSPDEAIVLIIIKVLGTALLGVCVLVWWAFASRATGRERVLGTLGVLLAAGLATVLSHPTMKGPGTIMIAVPLGTAALAVAGILLRRHLTFRRTWAVAGAAACGFGFVTLLRGDGMWGSGKLDWHWRWEPSAEERMLADRGTAPSSMDGSAASSEIDTWLADPLWPRFRGSDGRSQQHGSVINPDWNSHPPQLLWKIPIGPGWSSFVVAGNLLFTQEQIGDSEAVVCYAADSGQEVWRQEITSRWDDPLGGPGPRATPTLASAALYAQGALGQLQRLDPKTGDVVWVQDVREIAECQPPEWGFSSSPLVVDSAVIVHAGDGREVGKILAFDTDTGKLKWSVAVGTHSYSSAQLCMVADQPCVVMLTNDGMTLLQADSGQTLLSYAWKHGGYRALQPQVVADNSILMPTQELGTRRVRISDSGGEMQAEELWTSRHLKPDFNDCVIHQNHLYGFDGMIFTCIDLENGERQWKGGRYGKGQVLLLADSDLLLIASEKGDVILVAADPAGHNEVARFKALEGRTWNHPVVVNDRLYVRNSQQAACYQLPLLATGIAP